MVDVSQRGTVDKMVVLRNVAPWAKLAFAYYVTLSHLAVDAHSLCALVSQPSIRIRGCTQ